MGLGKAAMGAAQYAGSRADKKNNVRPDYEIADEHYENVSMYEQLAQSGYGEDALSRMNNQALRGLSTSLATGLQMGMNTNGVSDYYSNYLAQMGDVATKNIQMQFQHINNLAKAREDLSREKFIEFGYDEDAPYKDRAQAAAAGISQGIGSVIGGLDTAGQGLVAGGQRKLYEKQLDVLTGSLSNKAPVRASPQPVDIIGGYVTPPDPDAMATKYLSNLGYRKFTK